jgi:hypothetical protein
MSLGEKGGIGKTLLSRILANYLNVAGCTWRGIDTDLANKGLLPFHPDEVSPLNLYDQAGIRDEAAITAFGNFVGEAAEAGKIDALLMDVGAAQLDPIMGAMRETGLLRLLGKTLRIKAFFSVVNTPDSVSALRNNITRFDDLPAVQWVVVRNFRDGPPDTYDNSKTVRPELLKRGAYEIAIPLMRDPRVMAAWSDTQLSLAKFCHPTSGASWGTISRLEMWADEVNSELKRIGVTQ